MKKAKKILALALSLAMVAGISVAATLAYLKSSSDPVTNTFVVGNLFDDNHNKDDSLFLKEADVEPFKDGYKFTSATPAYNTSAPGITYDNLEKGNTVDKGVQINAGNFKVDAFVFVKVSNTTGVALTIDTTNTWVSIDSTNGVYAYKEVVSRDATQLITPKVFEQQITVTDDMVTAATSSIGVTLYACQSEGFEYGAGKTYTTFQQAATAAWNACFATA